MEKLIPDHNTEIDDIARRIIIMKLERPESDINGILASLKSKINHQILGLSIWAGEDGLLWASEKR
jgi:hypothetical protein